MALPEGREVTWWRRLKGGRLGGCESAIGGVGRSVAVTPSR